MKFNASEPLSRSAKRVLTSMCEALFSLLCEKKFEEISVSQICDESGYPRATFYNYFDDKYDLLNLIWVYVEQSVIESGFESYSTAETFDVHFDRLYDLLDAYEEQIKKVLVHNKKDGYFASSLGIYLRNSVKKLLLSMSTEQLSPVPIDMLTDHYTNTLLLVFGYRFEGKGERFGREKTKEYLYHLIKGSLNIPLLSGE